MITQGVTIHANTLTNSLYRKVVECFSMTLDFFFFLTKSWISQLFYMQFWVQRIKENSKNDHLKKNPEIFPRITDTYENNRNMTMQIQQVLQVFCVYFHRHFIHLKFKMCSSFAIKKKLKKKKKQVTLVIPVTLPTYSIQIQTRTTLSKTLEKENEVMS